MGIKHAVALRAFDHLGDSFAPGPAFPLDAGHFADWSAPGVDLVREATAAEIAKAKGEKVSGDKPARRAPAKRAAKAKPAAAPVPTDPEPASTAG